ncbi:MAG: cytochrome c [Acidimicrobiia bacterium]|nr:cytochrome c [Acidimicrobiia bacterium]
MRRLAITVVVALSLVAAGCGDDDAGGDAAATTTEAPATTGQAIVGDPDHGLEIYEGSCMVCHGPNGEGIEGLGKPWQGSDFINTHTDEELIEFIKEGRASDHPDNDTGIAMPPYGGNTTLTDDDLQDLVAYMRTLNL